MSNTLDQLSELRLFRLKLELKYSALDESERLTVTHFQEGSQFMTNVVSLPVETNAMGDQIVQ